VAANFRGRGGAEPCVHAELGYAHSRRAARRKRSRARESRLRHLRRTSGSSREVGESPGGSTLAASDTVRGLSRSARPRILQGNLVLLAHEIPENREVFRVGPRDGRDRPREVSGRGTGRGTARRDSADRLPSPFNAELLAPIADAVEDDGERPSRVIRGNPR